MVDNIKNMQICNNNNNNNNNGNNKSSNNKHYRKENYESRNPLQLAVFALKV
jgi:hypothetical protein